MNMKTKECEICGEFFETEHLRQKYCIECGKNPEKARKKYDKAVIQVSKNMGVYEIPWKKTCGYCKKTFMTTSLRKYCNKSCEKSARIAEAKCRVCKDLLINHGNYTGKGVCSKECEERLPIIQETKRNKKEAERIRKARVNGDYVSCKFCNKYFVRKDYEEFCSNICSKNHELELKHKKEVEKRNSPDWVDPNTLETRTCDYCKEPYICEHYYALNYCSNECRKKGEKRQKQIKRNAEKRSAFQFANLCIDCKTSQKLCERFTSKFLRLPEGTKEKQINGKNIVYECLKYSNDKKLE